MLTEIFKSTGTKYSNYFRDNMYQNSVAKIGLTRLIEIW